MLTSLRADPEASSESIMVAAHAKLFVEVDAQAGRYEYQLISESPLDFYFLGSDALAAYKQSGELENLPLLDQAESITYYETFVQTDADLDFGLLFVNNEDSEVILRVDLVFFPEPPFPGGRAGVRLLPYLLPSGLVLLVVGAILLFLSRRKQSAATSSEDAPEA